jgi:hypothetical protein
VTVSQSGVFTAILRRSVLDGGWPRKLRFRSDKADAHGLRRRLEGVTLSLRGRIGVDEVGCDVLLAPADGRAAADTVANPPIRHARRSADLRVAHGSGRRGGWCAAAVLIDADRERPMSAISSSAGRGPLRRHLFPDLVHGEDRGLHPVRGAIRRQA